MIGADTELDFDQDYGSTGSAQATSLLPEQEQALELIGHLTSYSDMLVVVTGPDGSGKTLLARTLADRREQPDDTLFITADLMFGMPALLRRIASHWNLSLPQEPGAARERIRAEALERAQIGGSLLLVIDQAEQLDADTLNDIAHLALLAPQALMFILFGLTGFERSLRGGPAQAPVHIQQLQPLSKESAQQLLQQVNPGALKAAELNAAWQQSQGWPGALLRHAGEYTLSVTPDDVPKPRARKEKREKKASGGFPVTHILAVATLVAALGIALLYRDDGSDQVIEEVTTIPLQDDFLRGSVGDDMSTGRESLPGDELAEPDAVPAIPPMDESVPASDADYNYAPGAMESAPVAADTGIRTPEPVVPATPVAPARTEPVKVAPVATQAPAASAAAGDRQRLLAVQSGYVVQLFGSYNSANADKFRRQWQEQIIGTLYLYETRHNNKPWFVVVSGVYGSRAEATAAVNALPRPLRSQSPWIRDITAVQKVLR